MTWLDRVKTDFVILCGGDLSEDENGTLSVGDGIKAFKPKWLNASRHIDYTIAEFVFKKLPGSLVKRGVPRGTQYNIEIIFDGADHLDVAKDFLTKSSYVDPQTGLAPPWKITHPYYGAIFVQPVSLTQDNAVYNVSTITGMVIETIKDDGQAFTPGDAESNIVAEAARVNTSYTRSYVADVPKPKVSDLQMLKRNLNNSYNSIVGMMNGIQKNADTYLKYYNDANSLINTAAFDTQDLLIRTQKMLGAPAYFADSVVNRLNMFVTQAIILNREVERILALGNKPGNTLKHLYENNAATGIIGMCLSTILNVTDDYLYRPKVLGVIDTLITQHNTFLTNLWRLQSQTGGMLLGYVPNAANVTAVSQLVKLTTGTLFNISAGARQERAMYLDYDTNLILVASKLYGMKADDSTMKQLVDNNNIGLNEHLCLRKGRKIIYYV